LLTAERVENFENWLFQQYRDFLELGIPGVGHGDRFHSTVGRVLE
jgi:hypothetical protein